MDTEVKPDGTHQVPNTEGQNTETALTLEAALAEIDKLKGITKEVISERDKQKGKLRDFERQQEEREQALQLEQGKYKELYEKATSEVTALKTGLKNKAVDAALKDVLQKAGARSVDTVAKLIDKSQISVNEEDWNVDLDSITTQIENLKKTDSILFGAGEGANLPPVKRPSDGTTTSGFEQEIRAAKSHKEIEAVMRKYGKI
jgi:hypothetical protein